MIERTTSTLIPAEATIRPLKDRLFIKPLDIKFSEIIECIRFGRPVRGKVIAAGPGNYRRRYNRDRSKTWESKTFIPMQVKVGDIVELGGLNIFDGQGYSFDEVLYGTERLLVITEKDVAGVVDG